MSLKDFMISAAGIIELVAWRAITMEEGAERLVKLVDELKRRNYLND